MILPTSFAANWNAINKLNCNLLPMPKPQMHSAWILPQRQSSHPSWHWKSISW
jgi:hypothetical protein